MWGASFSLQNFPFIFKAKAPPQGPRLSVKHLLLPTHYALNTLLCPHTASAFEFNVAFRLRQCPQLWLRVRIIWRTLKDNCDLGPFHHQNHLQFKNHCWIWLRPYDGNSKFKEWCSGCTVIIDWRETLQWFVETFRSAAAWTPKCRVVLTWATHIPHALCL